MNLNKKYKLLKTKLGFLTTAEKVKKYKVRF